MWFRQFKIFRLTKLVSSSAPELQKKLAPFSFTACLPSLPQSAGFCSPIDEENAPLVRGLNSCLMFALRLEEKILPASVIKETLLAKVKQIENDEARKMRHKEKLSYKDEVIQTLLPRAFSKFQTIYCYIDTRTQLLYINSTSPKKIDLVLTNFKRAVGDIVEPLDLVKQASLLTHWLKEKSYPHAFAIEKSAVLQDPTQQNRVIRAQQQDLFSSSMQTLIKEGCEVIQLGLSWQDRLVFVLGQDFTIKSLALADDDLAELKEDIETKSQRFDADFLMMTELYAQLMQDLLPIFSKNSTEDEAKKLAQAS